MHVILCYNTKVYSVSVCSQNQGPWSCLGQIDERLGREIEGLSLGIGLGQLGLVHMPESRTHLTHLVHADVVQVIDGVNGFDQPAVWWVHAESQQWLQWQTIELSKRA